MYPCLVPLPIGNDSASPCSVLTVASCAQYRLPMRQSGDEQHPCLSEQPKAFHNPCSQRLYCYSILRVTFIGPGAYMFLVQIEKRECASQRT